MAYHFLTASTFTSAYPKYIDIRKPYPGASIKYPCNLGNLKKVNYLVQPGSFETTCSFYSMRAFNKEDLPTLDLPKKITSLSVLS